ncbi:DUF3322 domain-containing protein [Myceligenerans halotolerans]
MLSRRTSSNPNPPSPRSSDGGDDARPAVALRPPTERHVLAGVEAARSWAESWREAEGRMPVDVEWAERR